MKASDSSYTRNWSSTKAGARVAIAYAVGGRAAWRAGLFLGVNGDKLLVSYGSRRMSVSPERVVRVA